MNDDNPCNEIYLDSTDIYQGGVADIPKNALATPLEQVYDFMRDLAIPPAEATIAYKPSWSAWSDHAAGIEGISYDYVRASSRVHYPEWISPAYYPDLKKAIIYPTYDSITQRYWTIPAGVKSIRNYINMQMMDEQTPVGF